MDTSWAAVVSPPGAVSCSSGEMGGSDAPTMGGSAGAPAWGRAKGCGRGDALSPRPMDRWAAASFAAGGAAAPSRAT
uniref:Uncharacterized protein n=1 Tax=Human herpesvirus 1 TaxID=10298 RepID=A0A2Z4GZR2_HHV1|nr:hypothetical protein [Human alphaherpesvirus 1]